MLQKWTYLNHGAFGGVCKPAYEEASHWREYCEHQPLKFLDRCMCSLHTGKDCAGTPGSCTPSTAKSNGSVSITGSSGKHSVSLSSHCCRPPTAQGAVPSRCASHARAWRLHARQPSCESGCLQPAITPPKQSAISRDCQMRNSNPSQPSFISVTVPDV